MSRPMVFRRAGLATLSALLIVVPATQSAVLAQGVEPGLLDQMVEVWAESQDRDLVRDYPDGPPDSPWLRVTDPAEDNNIFSTGEMTGLDDIPPNIDILGLSGERWEPPTEFFTPVEAGGLFCEDPAGPDLPDFFTFCGEDGIEASAFGDGASVFSFELGAGVGGFRRAGRTCEWVLWFDVATAGETWDNREAFPNDPAGGTNRAIGLRISDDGAAPFRLDIIDGFFTPAPTKSVVATGGTLLDIHIPNSEIDGATAVNGYTFCTDGGYTAADSTSDQTGLSPLDGESTAAFTFVDAPVEPVEIEEPDEPSEPTQPAVVEEPEEAVDPQEPVGPSVVNPPADQVSSVEVAQPLVTEPGGSFVSPLSLVALGVLFMLLAALIAFFPGLTVGSTSDRCVKERREVNRWEAELKKAIAAEQARLAEDEKLKNRLKEAPFDRKLKPMERAKLEERLTEQSSSAFHALQNARAYVRTVRETLAKARAALEACEKRPKSGGPTAPGTAGGETSPGGTAPPAGGSSVTPTPPNCCPKGNWIGVNVFTGGMGVIYGRESGFVTLWCMEDPGKWVVLSWSGTRWGLGLGGEVSAGLFIVAGGGIHPAELTAPVAKILGGFDFDISLGVSFSKLVKGVAKAGFSWNRWKNLKKAVETAKGAAKSLQEARKAKDVAAATKIATKNAEVFEELIKDGRADDLLEMAVKGSGSAAQAGGSGVNIPHGTALQLAGWKLVDVNVELWDLSGCKKCDPSK